MPLNQIEGVHFRLPQLVAVTPFDDVRDYDNYIARLRKVPRLFSQLVDDMQHGIAAGRVQPKLVSAKVLAQVESILAIAPEDSPFLAPTRNFPAGISAVARERISSEINLAVTRDVAPPTGASRSFCKRHTFQKVVPNPVSGRFQMAPRTTPSAYVETRRWR